MKTILILYPLGLSKELEENLKHGQINYISEVGYIVIGDTFEKVKQELEGIMESLKQIWEPINQAGVFFFDEKEFIEKPQEYTRSHPKNIRIHQHNALYERWSSDGNLRSTRWQAVFRHNSPIGMGH
ncbi:hypothetical protein [Thermococcus sp. ES12]|uniref:hypothetical protein n=1 Tax=Thermococcus sp. ES12 TaxID=1638246 RepID=UPI001431B9FE|nr:hypothetical protein [Thermococcus sp. ES12]NJE75962.1 hypothetical protein [Thermococcus sp. ES12]